ncbi:MAG: sulfite exporter TauE/SafE family protein [Acidobacteria bacterium]|nr:sulfite exporter TauE/SafE family protein [Acidobacteriota bacterium]
MPSTELTFLTLTAAGVGFVHTLLGPDHYVPFAMMARAGNWSKLKTTVVTLACGLGHVLSSVVMGAAGMALGMAVARTAGLESFRDRLAAWFLIGFGLAYFAWGMQRALRGRPHTHVRAHADGTIHFHSHVHQDGDSHLHGAAAVADAWSAARFTPWVLFTIFVTGPCKPLIPLLMYPAAQKSVAGVILVTAVFGAATLTTMCLAVLACQFGLERLPLGPLERYTNALAGAAIAACGMAIRFLSF